MNFTLNASLHDTAQIRPQRLLLPSRWLGITLGFRCLLEGSLIGWMRTPCKCQRVSQFPVLVLRTPEVVLVCFRAHVCGFLKFVLFPIRTFCSTRISRSVVQKTIAFVGGSDRCKSNRNM